MRDPGGGPYGEYPRRRSYPRRPAGYPSFHNPGPPGPAPGDAYGYGVPGTQPSGPAAWSPYPGGQPAPAGRRSRSPFWRRLAKGAAWFALLQALAVLSLIVVTPPTTRYMWANPDGAIQEWTDVEQVSRNFLIVVMGQEDQQFPDRLHAVDFGLFRDRVQVYLDGGQDDSGSTIPQQLVKNLVLSPDQTAARKGVELVLAEEAALLLPDRRVLELYVNYAQFAPNVYGVCAASWYYFNHSSKKLTVDESAQLVGLLPSPLHVHRAPGGGLEFDDPNGDGHIVKPEPGEVSARGVWRAQALAPGWFTQMKGYAATEALGIPGRAYQQPAGPGDCSTMPEAVRAQIEREGTG